jgi:hypothetical protein
MSDPDLTFHHNFVPSSALFLTDAFLLIIAVSKTLESEPPNSPCSELKSWRSLVLDRTFLLPIEKNKSYQNEILFLAMNIFLHLQVTKPEHVIYNYDFYINYQWLIYISIHQHNKSWHFVLIDNVPKL